MHERADLYFLAERSLGDEAWFCCPRCGNKKLKDFEMQEGFIQFSRNKKSCGVLRVWRGQRVADRDCADVPDGAHHDFGADSAMTRFAVKNRDGELDCVGVWQGGYPGFWNGGLWKSSAGTAG